MAVYFVDGGRADDSGDGLRWDAAKKTLQAALTIATSGADIVVVKYNPSASSDAELGGNTTFTAGANVSIISASADDAATAYTPTPMGSLGSYNWIGNSTTARSITIAGAYNIYMYGLNFRVTGGASITLGATNAQTLTAENCLFTWSGNSAGSYPTIGSNAGASDIAVHLIGCTINFSNAGQGILCRESMTYIENCTATGTSQTTMFLSTFCGSVDVNGGDFSNATNLVAATTAVKKFQFRQVKVPSGILAAQSTNNRCHVEVTCYDCASDNTHYKFFYGNGLGTLEVDAGVYVTADGAEYSNGSTTPVSWKIVTTAGATFQNPFITPWISRHNETVSASTVSPYLEALSATTGLNESELWSEWMYKATNDSSAGAIDRSDRGGITASTTDQGASALSETDWTETGTNYTYKLAPAAALTAAEIGDLCARVCVGRASATVYVDPQIRGLS